MLVSRGRNPSATEVITQLVQNPELRGRVLTTLGDAHACPAGDLHPHAWDRSCCF